RQPAATLVAQRGDDRDQRTGSALRDVDRVGQVLEHLVDPLGQDVLQATGDLTDEPADGAGYAGHAGLELRQNDVRHLLDGLACLVPEVALDHTTEVLPALDDVR